MIGAQKLLGVDLMTAHWEFTYGAERMKRAVDKDLGGIEFLAQNVKTADFEDPVFKPYSLRTMNGVPLAIIGQAFPYTPIAHPRHMVPDWTFGIQEPRLQKLVDEVRGKGAQLVVLLSHNGMDVDLKLAARVRGIDLILGGHTHDGVPAPVAVANGGGRTLVTNAGSNGKFLALVDLQVSGGKLADVRYRLMPVFSELLPPDAAMAAHIGHTRAPHASKLAEKLAITEGLLFRRGNFNGSFDQIILDALMQEKGAQIAFSPGFRWGTSILPGEAITLEHLMDQTAITYPFSTVNEMSGAQIKAILEDVCDNLFNPDPYLQQGGDMVRVGGMSYSCSPNATIGARISEMRIDGRPIEADKTYKVAGWAPVAEGASGEPVWELVARYLRERKIIARKALNLPRLIGIERDRGGERGGRAKQFTGNYVCISNHRPTNKAARWHDLAMIKPGSACLALSTFQVKHETSTTGLHTHRIDDRGRDHRDSGGGGFACLSGLHHPCGREFPGGSWFWRGGLKTAVTETHASRARATRPEPATCNTNIGTTFVIPTANVASAIFGG